MAPVLPSVAGPLLWEVIIPCNPYVKASQITANAVARPFRECEMAP